MRLGVVQNVGLNSLRVKADNEEHRVVFSSRSFPDDKMINVFVTHKPLTGVGECCDFLGQPIHIHDSVLFMEAPSQGYSTSFVLGEVVRLSNQEVTIAVRTSTVKKYMRKQDNVVVSSTQAF